MKKDKLDCPICKYLYDEEVIEINLGKKFNCESCNVEIFSRLRKDGSIFVDTMNLNKTFRSKREKDTKKFLDRIIKICIWEERKEYSSRLLEEFITGYNKGWIKRARMRMGQRCQTADINPPSVKRYFQSNGGDMDIRIIKYYIRGKKYQYPKKY